MRVGSYQSSHHSIAFFEDVEFLESAQKVNQDAACFAPRTCRARCQVSLFVLRWWAWEEGEVFFLVPCSHQKVQTEVQRDMIPSNVLPWCEKEPLGAPVAWLDSAPDSGPGSWLCRQKTVGALAPVDWTVQQESSFLWPWLAWGLRYPPHQWFDIQRSSLAKERQARSIIWRFCLWRVSWKVRSLAGAYLRFHHFHSAFAGSCAGGFQFFEMQWCYRGYICLVWLDADFAVYDIYIYIKISIIMIIITIVIMIKMIIRMIIITTFTWQPLVLLLLHLWAPLQSTQPQVSDHGPGPSQRQTQSRNFRRAHPHLVVCCSSWNPWNPKQLNP